jgi:hypothetical protein
MLTQSRREFLKTVGAAGIGASAVWAQTKNGNGSGGKENAQTKAQTKKAVSKIQVPKSR